MKENTLRLQETISKLPHLHKFFDDDFVKRQCENRLTNYLLKVEVSDPTRPDLAYLDKRLGEFASVAGYDRLGRVLRGASDWDEYQEFLAQIDITLWFKQKNLLNEIEPSLPHRNGYGDILITFSDVHIYCEVCSFQSLGKSIESQTEDKAIKMQNTIKKVREKAPWKSNQDVEIDLQIDRAVRRLLEKTNRQLSPDYPGILCLETGKSAFFEYKVKEVANKLFPRRPQVLLIGHWSLERGSQIGEPPFWSINNSSPFQNVGQKLLQHLK